MPLEEFTQEPNRKTELQEKDHFQRQIEREERDIQESDTENEILFDMMKSVEKDIYPSKQVVDTFASKALSLLPFKFKGDEEKARVWVASLFRDHSNGMNIFAEQILANNEAIDQRKKNIKEIQEDRMENLDKKYAV